MKLLLIFSMLLLCAPVFPNDFSGTTWALSGVGCRDGSLSASTHVSRSSTSGDVTAGIFHFVNESNVNMTVILRGKEESRSGTYSVNGTNITIRSGFQRMTVNIVEETLIVVGSRSESVQECCNAKQVENWRGYKANLIQAEGTATWEQEKAEKGWDEDWLAGNREEFDRLKTKCREEKPFVYVLGEV